VFESTLINIACHLFSRDFKFQIYSDSRDPSIESLIGNSQLNENPFIAIQSIEERYETEENLLEAIAAGDHARAILYHGKSRNFKIMPRSENTLINRKNLVIVLNTLCRKAVQKGHVHPMYIDELSTRFAIQINQIRSLKELDTLESDMIHKYCLLVYNHSMKNYSQIVQQCITYTDFHYAEPLTLAFFAERCHVTKSYLSSLFKKETGRNLTDYIHSVRISHSLFLLNSTQMPIHIVAMNCGYNDINYFIKLFKRLNGISPKQYRIQLRNN
jgi:YesN/AraC family two-component response regulator